MSWLLEDVAKIKLRIRKYEIYYIKNLIIFLQMYSILARYNIEPET